MNSTLCELGPAFDRHYAARTAMTPADVLKLIAEKDAKFADRALPIPLARNSTSRCQPVAGWKGINESDTILLPEPATAVIDPLEMYYSL